MSTTSTTFASTNSATTILTPRYCTNRIVWIKKRLDEGHIKQLTPYQTQILELTRSLENPDRRSRFKHIFEGLPCHRCRKLITIGSEFYSRGTRSSKIYHLSCAKEVHLI